MTSMLHIAPEASEFDKMRSLGELESLTQSRFAQQFLAEGYTGWAYEAEDWL
jgi:p-hydroxybenzoate 3-monooxygenase